jgi:hypothetical protein
MGHAGHLLLAALLSVQFEVDLGPLVNHFRQSRPADTCGVRFIGYRFIGQPHQPFEYMGETYEIGDYGYVELIAGYGRQSMQYKVDGVVVQIQHEPADVFLGFVDVRLRGNPA